MNAQLSGNTYLKTNEDDNVVLSVLFTHGKVDVDLHDTLQAIGSLYWAHTGKNVDLPEILEGMIEEIQHSMDKNQKPKITGTDLYNEAARKLSFLKAKVATGGFDNMLRDIKEGARLGIASSQLVLAVISEDLVTASSIADNGGIIEKLPALVRYADKHKVWITSLADAA